MKNVVLIKLFLLSAMAIMLTGCETCPNMIHQADIGIRISPMACVSKANKVHAQESSDDDDGDSGQDDSKGSDD